MPKFNREDDDPYLEAEKRDCIELPVLYVDPDSLDWQQPGIRESYNNYAPMDYLSAVDHNQRINIVELA